MSGVLGPESGFSTWIGGYLSVISVPEYLAFNGVMQVTAKVEIHQRRGQVHQDRHVDRPGDDGALFPAQRLAVRLACVNRRGGAAYQW